MKKIFSMALVLLSGIMALTSCSEDRDDNPQIQTPTQFVLNNPVLAEQFVQLTEQNSVNLTWSQPNYSYNAFASYMVQVGIVQADGSTKWNEKTDENGKVTPVYLEKEYTVCNADVSGNEIAMALCAIDGVTEEDQYVDKGFREVAFRLKSVIKTTAGNVVPGSEIVSNSVSFKHMAGFCAIKSPAYVYLIGEPHGWIAPEAANAETLAGWRIYETQVGSNVFKGSLNIPAGKFRFRFYSTLSGWDGGASIGAQEDDKPITIELADNTYEGELAAPGKGSWEVADFAGGFVTITLDMNQKKVKFEYTGGKQAEAPTGFIYLVGAPEGWTGPTEENAAHYENWKLFSYPSTGEGVYTATFNIEAGKAMFRFYTALTGWNADSYGSQADDSPVDIALTDGKYTGSSTAGKGSWNIADWKGGKLKIVVDKNKNEVTFTKVQ